MNAGTDHVSDYFKRNINPSPESDRGMAAYDTSMLAESTRWKNGISTHPPHSIFIRHARYWAHAGKMVVSRYSTLAKFMLYSQDYLFLGLEIKDEIFQRV
jgi:hypothetical protein